MAEVLTCLVLEIATLIFGTSLVVSDWVQFPFLAIFTKITQGLFKVTLG